MPKKTDKPLEPVESVEYEEIFDEDEAKWRKVAK